MRMKICRKLPLLLCMFGMLLWMIAAMLPVYASAADSIGSLTIFCQTQEGIILSDANWQLYAIGERAQDGSFELNDEFSVYPVSLKDTSKSAISDAAQTLASYCVSDRLEPLAEKATDAAGKVRFEELPYGLYLLIGEMVKQGDVCYLYSPFIIEVPAPDTKDVDIIAYPKSKFMSWSEGGYEYTVRKIWKNDEDQPQLRSVSITAKLYRDGELFETVVLDESNDWTYSWYVSEMHEWSVIEEDVPDGYTVLYTNNGVQYAIVNTYSDDAPKETTTTPESTATTETSTQTESTATTTITETEKTTVTTTTTKTTTTTTAATKPAKPEKLPQTGQLWWPVPVLAIAGAVLTAIGLKLRTKE